MKTHFGQYVGQRIKAIRARLDLSQKDLAEDAGLSVSRLSEIERGKGCVSLINAVNIAHALGVPLSYLLPR